MHARPSQACNTPASITSRRPLSVHHTCTSICTHTVAAPGIEPSLPQANAHTCTHAHTFAIIAPGTAPRMDLLDPTVASCSMFLLAPKSASFTVPLHACASSEAWHCFTPVKCHANAAAGHWPLASTCQLVQGLSEAAPGFG